MASSIRKKGGLIIAGALLVGLTLFIVISNREPHGITYEVTPDLVGTRDPLIIKRLSEQELLPTDVPLVTFIDPVRGPEDAAVTIVEFSDFECPFCNDAQVVIDRILAAHPHTVRHVWKDAPSQSIHINALSAHIAARCGQEQGAFWEYHDALFERQTDLNDTTYFSIARKLFLNTRSWEQCFDEEIPLPRVKRNIEEAEALGVDTLPFFFINDKRVSGSITFEKLDELVREELRS